MDEDGFSGEFTDNDNPSSLRVAIWGLGLMGGSLAMALQGKVAYLAGVDPDASTRALALERGVVDAVYSPEALRLGAERLGAVDLIVLAAPVRAILQTLADLPSLVDGEIVVIDLGSTKADIVEVMNRLPDRFDAVGGHPMCGKEQSSLRFADASLYRAAPFALIATTGTTERGRGMAEWLAHSSGACPLWIDADTHDRWVAATSHIPFLLSSALVRATPLDAAPMIGPGFRGMARLAGGSTRMMIDILTTNRSNIREALGRVRDAVEAWEALLEHSDEAALVEMLDEASACYHILKGDQ